ncbi:uncharacterized protein LOC112515482 isoform X1 [Cynara cardunculus var. scolymus]|uniref:uncharacterized protein LOC112515482 isoform X1 n=1 Tax=Cynara cardunculus var. scolymus TaxID=59895 RepID=UPI000D62E021|nr:uncharacterized protein LOC112515482 isoform X1 [Cynara cardunculus var. scolymus]
MMNDDYEVEQKKQSAADVTFQYSNFVMACIGFQARPCDMRLHLMKVVWVILNIDRWNSGDIGDASFAEEGDIASSCISRCNGGNIKLRYCKT